MRWSGLPMRISCSFLSFVLLAGGFAQAQDPAIVQQARAYLGTEQALEAIDAVRYRGQLTSTDTVGTGESRTVEAMVDILFQKPAQQRIVAQAGNKIEVTALDGYEAWQWVHDPADPASPRLTLLGPEQVKRLRANTWENLYFFKAAQRSGGEVVDQGRVDLNGQPAHKLAFYHDEQIVFIRYFDPASGRLLQTETGRGDRIREDGEIQAGGIRFPERVITDTPLPDGGHRTVTVIFDSIEVNDPLPPEAFGVPMMGETPMLEMIPAAGADGSAGP